MIGRLYAHVLSLSVADPTISAGAPSQAPSRLGTFSRVPKLSPSMSKPAIIQGRPRRPAAMHRMRAPVRSMFGIRVGGREKSRRPPSMPMWRHHSFRSVALVPCRTAAGVVELSASSNPPYSVHTTHMPKQAAMATGRASRSRPRPFTERAAKEER